MSKRVLRLVSILFLSSILVLSCSNAGKTGSGDNNSGNGGSSTGGDGGTTPQGIAKYAGTWTATFDEKTSYDVVIGNDGSVTIKDGSKNPKQAKDITENGNTYTMKVQHIPDVDYDVIITFTDTNSGSIYDSFFLNPGNTVDMRKQNI